MNQLILVCSIAVCGGCGALCRWKMDLKLRQLNWRAGWPIAAVNILACALIGLAAGTTQLIAFSSLYALLVTGFLGGFSTFSTHLFDGFQALRSGSWGSAGLLTLGTWLLSTGALLLGYALPTVF